MVFVVAVWDAIDTKHTVVFGNESLARFGMLVNYDVCRLWQQTVGQRAYEEERNVEVHLEKRLAAASRPTRMGAPHQTW